MWKMGGPIAVKHIREYGLATVFLIFETFKFCIVSMKSFFLL